MCQLSCFGQERWARLGTSRKQQALQTSAPAYRCLQNTCLTLNLLCILMTTNLSVIRGSSQILCLRLSLVPGSAKKLWRTAFASSAMQAALFSGGNRGCTCTRCMQAFNKPKLKEWFSTGPCASLQRRNVAGPSASSLEEFDEGVSPTSVAEGRLAASILHPSHRSYQKRGYIWCWKCGAWGSTKPGKLRKPCASVPSMAGKEVLVRVRRGLKPKSEAKWLLEEHEAPPAEGFV